MTQTWQKLQALQRVWRGAMELNAQHLPALHQRREDGAASSASHSHCSLQALQVQAILQSLQDCRLRHWTGMPSWHQQDAIAPHRKGSSEEAAQQQQQQQRR